MAARGPYKKGVAMRAHILATALEIIAERGYSSATVKEIADTVGLSQNGILRYFGSKDALFLEVLRTNEATIAEQVDPEHTDFAADLGQRILDAVDDNVRSPGFVQLLLRVSIEASEADHVAHALIRARYESFRSITASALREMKGRGEVPVTLDPDDCAVILASAMDGLQMQWLYDHSIDVTSKMASLLRSLGVPLKSSVPELAGARE